MNNRSKILDVGCGKGFLLYEIKKILPKITVRGFDISKYAIKNSKKEVKKYCRVADAADLPFDDDSIDVVTSITTLHNLEENELRVALLEIERVAKRGSFITLDAYKNDNEKDRMEAWNLTAKTVMHVDQWREFFADTGYSGDYYWFIP